MKRSQASLEPENANTDLQAPDIAWLQRLSVALHSGDEAQLAGVFADVDVQHVLGPRMIAGARMRGKSALVVLLSSLAVANDVQAKEAALWLARYQFITGAQEGLAPDDAQNLPVRLVCEALRNQSTHLINSTQASQAPVRDWLLGLALSLDHHAWAVAADLLQWAATSRLPAAFWAEVVRILTHRSRFWPRGQALAGVGAPFMVARTHWQASPSQKEALMLMQARLLVHAQAYVDAERIYRKLLNGAHAVVAHLEFGQMLCKAQRKEEALPVLDALLSRPLREWAHRALPDVAWAETKRASGDTFASDEAAQAFQAFHAALASLEQTAFFLVSGTLLGYARQGGLLGHDKDIDVGVVGWQSQFEIAQALLQSGAFTLDLDQLNGEACYTFAAVHTETNIAIDVFLYHQTDESWVTGVDFAYGHSQCFAFTPFDLMSVEFLGVTTHVPKNFAQNLSENFGPNWQIPDPGYMSHLESPSGVARGGVDHMITARLELFTAVRAGQTARLERVLRVLDEFSDGPFALEACVCDHLQSACHP